MMTSQNYSRTQSLETNMQTFELFCFISLSEEKECQFLYERLLCTTVSVSCGLVFLPRLPRRISLILSCRLDFRFNSLERSNCNW